MSKTETKLYHIKIDKSIKNKKDLKNVVTGIIFGYIDWLTRGFIDILLESGLSHEKIAALHPQKQTKQNISLFLKKETSNLVLQDAVKSTGEKENLPNKS